MKQVLLNLAVMMEEQIEAYKTYPKTQATDAMRGTLEVLHSMVCVEAAKLEDATTDLQTLISAEVTKQLSGLTGPAKPKKKVTKKS